MTREEKRSLWKERIKCYRDSGLTAAEWCKENNVNIHTFKTMITRLNMAQRSSKPKKNLQKDSESIQWVGIKTENKAPEEIAPQNNGLIVTIGSAEVKVSPGFDEKTLEKVIKIIQKKC